MMSALSPSCAWLLTAFTAISLSVIAHVSLFRGRGGGRMGRGPGGMQQDQRAAGRRERLAILPCPSEACPARGRRRSAPGGVGEDHGGGDKEHVGGDPGDQQVRGEGLRRAGEGGRRGGGGGRRSGWEEPSRQAGGLSKLCHRPMLRCTALSLTRILFSFFVLYAWIFFASVRWSCTLLIASQNALEVLEGRTCAGGRGGRRW